MEIYTYLPKENFPLNLESITKENVDEKIQEGKIVLMPWEDWKDEYGLVVVISEDKKVKDFRGAFLYEN